MGECVGIGSHEWTLHVENGRAALGTAPCGPDCPVADGHDLIPEDIYIEDLPVRVGLGTDCPAYDHDEDGFVSGRPTPMRGYESGSHYIAHGSRCDCNWWATAAALVGSTAQPLPENIEDYAYDGVPNEMRPPMCRRCDGYGLVADHTRGVAVLCPACGGVDGSNTDHTSASGGPT